MSVKFNPEGLKTEAFSPDKLLAGAVFKTKSVVLLTDAGADDDLAVRGRLLSVDVNGKYSAISSTETTVAIGAATGVEVDGISGSETEFDFVLANPPIPGTVHVVTTANGSATVVEEFGTDNGEGVGVGADGSFTVDYETGAIHVVFPATGTATNDLKVAYKYREVVVPANKTPLGLPKAILAEDVAGADLAADDVTVTVYTAGEFLGEALVGYSAGYASWLRQLGIIVR